MDPKELEKNLKGMTDYLKGVLEGLPKEEGQDQGKVNEAVDAVKAADVQIEKLTKAIHGCSSRKHKNK